MLLSLVPAAALLAVVAAEDGPRTSKYEDVAIADLHVRMFPENGTVMDVSFLLSGRDAANLSCSRHAPELPSAVFACGDSKYRFALYKGKTVDYALRVYHELGTGFGFYGAGDVFTYCHAGGLGTMVCAQQFPVTIRIDAEPDPPEKE